MERFKKTYAEKETLLGLALDINEGIREVNECAREVNECKSEVKEMFKQYLYQRESQAREFPPKFQ